MNDSSTTHETDTKTMTELQNPPMPSTVVNEPPEAVKSVDKSGRKVQGMFASIAHRYDLLNHLLSANIDKHWRSQTTRLAPPPAAGETIVDCCTGTGDLAVAYDVKSGGRNPIVATDFCRPMLVRTVPKLQKRQAENRIAVVESDAQHLPLPDNFAGLTTVAFGLRNIASTVCGLDEMIRVTKPGGRVAVLEFSRPTGMILGPIYMTFFRRILPKVGQTIAPNDANAYAYLPASVLEFPDGQAMLDLMAQRGLSQCWRKPMTFGIATLYVGTKPELS